MNTELGINTKGLSEDQVEALQKSVAGAIKVNENERKIETARAGEVQRRGRNLPGDVGGNFGLSGGDIHGYPGAEGPFGETYPGSYFFSGFFGSDGYGSPLSGGDLQYTAQGSYTGFKRNTSLSHRKMAICVSAYKGFGLAKNVIDLMANFAAEGLKIKHPNKTVERFLNRWAFHVDLNSRVKDMLRYYYKFGNVFIYRTLGEIDNASYLKMKRSKAKLESTSSIPGFVRAAPEVDEEGGEVQKKKAAHKIPWRYTLLNPFQMELRGTKFFGGQRWVFILDDNTVSEIRMGKLRNSQTYVDFLDESDINLPPEFRKSSQDLSKDAPDGENNDPRVVELDQSRLYTMHYMKDDHEDWAEPLLWPVMADIYYKNKLRQMDISVCNSVINSVTIFKLGNLKEGFIPPEEHFTKFAEFLRTPTAAMNMVWNDAISVESSYPPVERILGIQKYESVDRDILRGIGIPDTLVGGQIKTNFSSGFLGVRTLLERLEEARHTVMRWLTKELHLLVEALGIRKMPTIRFGKMSLRDEQAEKQLIIQLMDRNIISIEAVLETFGEDFGIELERLRDEERIREDTGLLQKHSPYTDPINDLSLEEQMEKEAEIRSKEEKSRRNRKRRNAKGPNGRPPGTDGIPHKKDRNTKPQGMAWLLNYETFKSNAIRHVDEVEKVVSKQVLAALGKKTKRSLTKAESQGIEEITFAVAEQTSWEDRVDEDVVRNILNSNPVINGEVHAVYVDMKREDMTLQDRKIAMASAIAYCRLKKE